MTGKYVRRDWYIAIDYFDSPEEGIVHRPLRREVRSCTTFEECMIISRYFNIDERKYIVHIKIDRELPMLSQKPNK